MLVTELDEYMKGNLQMEKGNRRKYKLAAELFLLTKLIREDFHPVTEDEEMITSIIKLTAKKNLKKKFPYITALPITLTQAFDMIKDMRKDSKND